MTLLDPRWREARNILLIRLDNLGDVLMTTPAFAAVRAGAPLARLTLMGSRSGVAMLRHLPMLDEVIPYEAPWVKGPARTPVADRRFIGMLARQGFDAAIIFTVCTQSALPAAMMCRLAGIPLRLAHCRENPYDLLSDWVPDNECIEDGMRHEVQRQLDLVAAVGFAPQRERLVFKHAEVETLSMRQKLAAAGVDCHRPMLVVHPGATAASRRYPPERFGQAADAVAAASGCQVVFTGGRDEAALVEACRAGMAGPSASLAGELTLGELAALIADADVLLCNNSGPAHMAAAVGTPVVVLYALTNPQHTPWRVPCVVLNEDVPCRNCLKSVCPERHHACLMKVPVEAVADATLRLMRMPVATAA